MNSCCRGFCTSVGRRFDTTVAQGDLDRYRQKGPNTTTRLMRDGILSSGGAGTVLDVGAGIGALSFELLAAGFSGATAVDAAPPPMGLPRARRPPALTGSASSRWRRRLCGHGTIPTPSRRRGAGPGGVLLSRVRTIAPGRGAEQPQPARAFVPACSLVRAPGHGASERLAPRRGQLVPDIHTPSWFDGDSNTRARLSARESPFHSGLVCRRVRAGDATGGVVLRPGARANPGGLNHG